MGVLFRHLLVRRLVFAVGVAAILIVGAAAARRAWHQPFTALVPSSTAMYDSQGRLLRLSLASDEKYRLWLPVAAMPPEFAEAVVLKEDRHFRLHPGVNPVALVRGAWRTFVRSDRQGGSTITMQLARLHHRLNTRTVGGKLAQVAWALRLELLYSKDEILEAYLNLVPYGQNIEGVGAASLVYFGRPARTLTLPEILALAVIPQSPARRTPGASELATLARSRQVLYQHWVEVHPDAARFRELVSAPLKLRSSRELPFAAPHLTTTLLAQQRDAPVVEITTLLDLRAQRAIERQVRRFVERQSAIGLRNAAVLLVDTRDMGVKALVGSAGFHDEEIEGQINGTLARRSPGSALKPFVYALALDQGLIHPLTMLRDAPSSFGSFSPENFDGQFVGPIAAKEALTRSRNVPAVGLAANLAQPSLYQFLKSAGVDRLKAERHYGLALALGGAEVTAEELAVLYATLANRGVMRPLRYRAIDPPAEGMRLLSDEASFITLDMLRGNPRPDLAFIEHGTAARVAWKTGTSWGFRDAWTAGVVGPFVLVVWIGNFDGSSNPAFVGVRAAAPLFFQIVDALRAESGAALEPLDRAPSGVSRVEVCAASGDLPNAHCPKRAWTWFIPGKSPIRLSDIHRPVMVDTRTGRAACPPFDPRHVREQVYEFWPSDLQRLFQQAGLPRRLPPAEADCGGSVITADTGPAPKILSPSRGTTYALRVGRGEGEPLALSASADADVQSLHWFVNDGYLGATPPQRSLAWKPTAAGRYVVRVVDDRGRADTREVQVDFVS